MYCQAKHGCGRGSLCPDCLSIESYALERIGKCPFNPDKPTCLKCPVHCYAPGERELMRVIMRHSGPRMLLNHPVLAMWHLTDGKRASKAGPKK